VASPTPSGKNKRLEPSSSGRRKGNIQARKESFGEKQGTKAEERSINRASEVNTYPSARTKKKRPYIKLRSGNYVVQKLSTEEFCILTPQGGRGRTSHMDMALYNPSPITRGHGFFKDPLLGKGTSYGGEPG